jgi:rod shape-determining protein MreD
VKPALHAVLALVLIGLQAALLRHVGGGAFTLAVPVILLVHLALTADLTEGTVAAAAVGYVLDVASGGTKGLLTSLAVATFLAVRVVRLAVEVHGWAGFAALCGLAVLGFSSAAVAVTRWVSPPEVQPLWGLLPRMAMAALLTAAISPSLFWGLRRLDAALGHQVSDLAP